MHVEIGEAVVVERLGEIALAVAVPVAGDPLLGVPEAALPGGPALDAEAAAGRRVDVEVGEAAVVERLGEVALAVAVAVAGDPLLGVPEAALPGGPARDAEAAAGRQVDVDVGEAAVVEHVGEVGL